MELSRTPPCLTGRGKFLRLAFIWAVVNILAIFIYNVHWKKAISFAPWSSSNQTVWERKIIYDDTIIDPSIFASTCNRSELFTIQRAKHFNATILRPADKENWCPRQLINGSSRLPLTALASFPGSGNTWTRHIIQQLTGLPTGSIYSDKSLRNNGFPFEGWVKNVIAVKTHGINHKNNSKYIPIQSFDKVIILLRNVYDSLLSDYKRYHLTRGHVSNAYINGSDSRFKTSIFSGISKWQNFIEDALSFQGPTLVVFYEDLKSDLLPQLVKMAEFLGTDEVTDFSFCCVVKESEGRFHRKSNAQTVEQVFSKQKYRRRINHSLQSVASMFHGTRHDNVARRLLKYKLPLI